MFIVELLAILSIALMVCCPCGLFYALYATLTNKKNTNSFNVAFNITIICIMMLLAGMLGMSFAAGIYSAVS